MTFFFIIFFLNFLFIYLFIYYFFLLFTFENNRNLFWAYQNGNFLPGKKHFTPGKKSGKMTLSPQKNIPVKPLMHSRVTEELRGAMRLVPNRMRNVRLMYTQI